MISRYLIYILLMTIFSVPNGYSQVPALAVQTEAIRIEGGTLHIGNGNVVQNGVIIFENGKILYAGAPEGAPKIKAKVIDARSKHIFPGFIAPNTTLGLVEIEAIRATRDNYEVGVFNPHVRALIAYMAESKVTPTVRSNGVLVAEVTPQGGSISGKSALMNLDGWNWEDAAEVGEAAIHLNWPSRSRARFGQTPSAGDDYSDALYRLKDFFEQSRAYLNKKNTEEANLRFQAMQSLFEGKLPLMIHANEPREIQDAVSFAKSYGIKPVVVGGSKSWKIAKFLKDEQVPVILSNIHSLPDEVDDPVDLPFKIAAILYEQGVTFSFSMDGSWQQRNLSFQAGQAVAYGLPYEAALSALTLNTARILGVEDRLGSLEKGKEATLFISGGDPLDSRSDKVVQAFIKGREIDLDNKQKDLFETYFQKYSREGVIKD